MPRRAKSRFRRGNPGSAPGLLRPIESPPPVLTLTFYNAERLETHTLQDPDELGAYLDADGVLWLDVRGLGDVEVLGRLRDLFKLNPLALEDVTNTPQRPKSEEYEHHRFAVCRMLERTRDGLHAEQLSLFVGHRWLLTFHERPEDPWSPIRERLQLGRGPIRTSGSDYLAYALIDAVVDGYFPVLEDYGEQLEALEDEILGRSRPATLAAVHQIRHDMLAFRRAVWPLRDALGGLMRDTSDYISPAVRDYLRDVHDHTFQVIDMIETYREVLAGLVDLYLSTASNRMNEVMKVLTIISTIFIPLTFIVGVYGMNFVDIPELHLKWGYGAVWLLMIAIGAAEIVYFRRKGWLGSPAAAPEEASLDPDPKA